MSTTTNQLRLRQTLIDGKDPAFRKILLITTQLASDLTSTKEALVELFGEATSVGLAPGYDARGKLAALAIATSGGVTIVEFDYPRFVRDGKPPPGPIPNKQEQKEGCELLEELVLCRGIGGLFAFDMGPLALSLFTDLSMRIVGAVDIQSAFPPPPGPGMPERFSPLDVVRSAVGGSGEIKINVNNLTSLFNRPAYDRTNLAEARRRAQDIALTAWLAYFLATYQNGSAGEFDKVKRVDTKKMSLAHLDIIAKISNDSLRLDMLKPMSTTIKIRGANMDGSNEKLLLQSAQFNNRLRNNQTIRVEVQGPNGAYRAKGTVDGVSGRSGAFETSQVGIASSASSPNNKGGIVAVTSHGKDGPTRSESARSAVILNALQGGTAKILEGNPWVRNIFRVVGKARGTGGEEGSEGEEGEGEAEGEFQLVWPEEWLVENPETSPSPTTPSAFPATRGRGRGGPGGRGGGGHANAQGQPGSPRGRGRGGGGGGDRSRGRGRGNPPPPASASASAGNLARHTSPILPSSPILSPTIARLNNSQKAAVNHMLSADPSDRIVIIQGPPGTGKTSVIAAFVEMAVLGRGEKGVWLVAQSNVAVKNIAEKLVSIGFMNWKLLVSKDFHFGWHEHIYHKVEKNLIRSEEFRFAFNKANLKGVDVILSTLAMVTHPQMKFLVQEVPLTTLIVDEASQIQIGDYISVFHQYATTLRKMCFIGDDKQLPPYGQEDLGSLQSIFEVDHLKQKVKFLNTQYRMPPQIGGLISEAVYDSKLLSNPHHPITEETIATYIVDVPGKERLQQDGSSKNDEECQVIIQLALKLQEQQKEYKIITPYEAQRSLIESTMQQTEGLEWEDKCFNVDSFQGNEEDYIIISVVRSRTIGFLGNLRRTNVMLSRAKKGMFIVSSKSFLMGAGAETLVGWFAKKILDNPSGKGKSWITEEDIQRQDFLQA